LKSAHRYWTGSFKSTVKPGKGVREFCKRTKPKRLLKASWKSDLAIANRQHYVGHGYNCIHADDSHARQRLRSANCDAWIEKKLRNNGHSAGAAN
jgi:hypothetical protein